jgi:hypothetical protein
VERGVGGRSGRGRTIKANNKREREREREKR